MDDKKFDAAVPVQAIFDTKEIGSVNTFPVTKEIVRSFVSP